MVTVCLCYKERILNHSPFISSAKVMNAIKCRTLSTMIHEFSPQTLLANGNSRNPEMTGIDYNVHACFSQENG